MVMWRGTVFIFCLFLVKQSHQQSLQFLEAPSDALVPPDSNHTLTCNVSSPSPVTITWFKDDSEIILDGQHLTNRSNGMELIITGVSRGTDEGIYYCVASSTSLGSVRSLDTMIRVAYIDSDSEPSNPRPLVHVREGHHFILNRTLPSSVPPVTVQWERGTTNVAMLPDSNRFSIYSSETTSSLIVSYFDLADGNTYSCSMTNNLVPGVTYDQEVADVTLDNGGSVSSRQQSFVVKPQDVEVVVGMIVKLQCFVVGQPVPSISWQKDNVSISPMTEQSGRVLLIPDVQSSDAGVYTCTSTQDGFDSINTTAVVSVIVPPRITVGVQHVDTLVGNSVELTCMAEGTSPITWEWRHNTSVVNNDDYYSVNENQLNITNTQFSHSGIYQCIASHANAGKAASNNNVILGTKQLSFLPGGGPRDQLAITGSSVVLMCNVTGAPSPQYVWYKDQSVLDTSSSSRFVLLDNSGSLEITSLQKSDAGVYRCNASNAVESISSEDSVLTVLDVPDIHYQPTHLMVIQNSSVIIPCEITIDEVTVDYFWLFNDNQLNFSSPRYTMGQGTGNVTITNVQEEDEGIYECLANLSLSDNMAGDVRFSIGSGMISVVFIPGSIDMPEVVNISARDVVVMWVPPLSDGGSNITLYIIEQRLVSLYGNSMVQDDANWVNVSSSDSLMSRITSLDPYTGYQFRVIAVNIAGDGMPSMPSMVTITLEEAPTAAPVMISVETGLESTELLVSWMAPPVRLLDGSGRNGVITNYSVLFQLDDNVQLPEMVTTDDNRTSLVLQGLMDSSVYRVMVAANTNAGRGPYSTAVTGATLHHVPQPPDPPGIVGSIIVSSTAITLQWMEPLTTVLNITGYEIMYRHPARENHNDVLIILPGHQVNITITGLDGGQLYIFNVSAVNVNGSGLPAVYTVTTPVGSPTHILALTGNRLSSDAVSLSWDAPPNGGSELYGFTIEGYSIFEHEWVRLAVLPANVTEYHLSASDGMIHADFRISAFNQYGSSETTTFGVGDPVTPEDAPNTLWFLVIFVLFGLFLVTLGIVILTVIFRKYRWVQSGGYSFRDTDNSDLGSLAPSTATFTNYEVKSHKASNIPLFSSDTAPFSDTNQPESSSSMTRSPLFSTTEFSRSHLTVPGYPPPTSNPDESTLTSGFSIDRPMFSDSTTVTSGESGPFAPFGYAAGDYNRQGYLATPQGQQMPFKEYSHKTVSLESDGTTYI